MTDSLESIGIIAISVMAGFVLGAMFFERLVAELKLVGEMFTL